LGQSFLSAFELALTRHCSHFSERFGASVRGFMLFIRTLFWLNFNLAIVWGVILQLTQLASFVNDSGVDAGQFLIGLFTGTVRRRR
jgi:hypothetical protein